ncbi:MAG: hypothetical protein KTV16_06360 [Acidimicrobiia bacterium]|nr:hypothetical protein [Acidimicrobiia bacterium]
MTALGALIGSTLGTLRARRTLLTREDRTQIFEAGGQFDRRVRQLLDAAVGQPALQGANVVAPRTRVAHHHFVEFDTLGTGSERAEDAYIATYYRGHWFWIEDSDLQSKSTFMLLRQLFDLQAGQSTFQGPTLTLPVGR